VNGSRASVPRSLVRVRSYRTSALVHCVLVLCVTARAHAQAPVNAAGSAQPSVNTWSARSTGGMLLMGTFTVVPDSVSGTVTGTWTLNRAHGDVVAQGAWSASKSPRGWTGAWRSVVSGSSREYTGTWSANTPLRATAGLPQLFLKAGVEQVISGGWRSAGNSGAWSIRLGT
jgi:hypothetical protein